MSSFLSSACIFAISPFCPATFAQGEWQREFQNASLAGHWANYDGNAPVRIVNSSLVEQTNFAGYLHRSSMSKDGGREIRKCPKNLPETNCSKLDAKPNNAVGQDEINFL